MITSLEHRRAHKALRRAVNSCLADDLRLIDEVCAEEVPLRKHTTQACTHLGRVTLTPGVRAQVRKSVAKNNGGRNGATWQRTKAVSPGAQGPATFPPAKPHIPPSFEAHLIEPMHTRGHLARAPALACCGFAYIPGGLRPQVINVIRLEAQRHGRLRAKAVAAVVGLMLHMSLLTALLPLMAGPPHQRCD